MEPVILLALALQCAPAVAPETTRALVSVESASNPFAIGVVGGSLVRQPRNHSEALATARALADNGRNFSVGLAQINVHNLGRLSLPLERAFEPCLNLQAMQTILMECFTRALSRQEQGRHRQPALRASRDQRALRDALSCYYSGNTVTGYRHGYVHRVLASARQALPAPITTASFTPTTPTKED
jgi:type IV secretion system protein VirB1